MFKCETVSFLSIKTLIFAVLIGNLYWGVYVSQYHSVQILKQRFCEMNGKYVLQQFFGDYGPNCFLARCSNLLPVFTIFESQSKGSLLFSVFVLI